MKVFFKTNKSIYIIFAFANLTIRVIDDLYF